LLYTSRFVLVNATGSSTASTVRKASLFYFVFVMFSYTTGGPFGLEGMVTTSGPGMSLIFLLVIHFPVDPGLARDRRTHHCHAGRRRLLSLEPRRIRRFLGISRGMVELVRLVPSRRSYAVLFTDYLAYYFPGIAG